jgi:tagatose 1,6-diphosphate aldolase
VLCGRATWKDGIPVYGKHGGKAFREWLSAKGVENIENVNQSLRAAKSWFPQYGVSA